MTSHRAGALIGAVTGLLLVASLLGVPTPGATALEVPDGDRTATVVAAPTPTRPNVIEVVTDDMSDFSCADTAKYLPESSPWLLQGGTCFENASVTDPVCCPARAEIQSGQMPHNNHVQRQSDALNFDHLHSVQHVLGGLGVLTDAIGKLFNGVRIDDLRTTTPAGTTTGTFRTGFDQFSIWDSYNYHSFTVKTQDGTVYAPPAPAQTTLQTGTLSRAFVSAAVRSGQPFLSYEAFYAPHEQVGRGTTEQDQFPSATLAHQDSPVPPFRFRPEQKAADKLHFFHKQKFDSAFYHADNAARVRALYDVDHEMAQMFQMLQDTGALADTVVLFASDNGYLLGQHNWKGKAVPYADAVNIPLLAYGPKWFTPGTVDTRLVSLLDLAPTIYDIYGVKDPGYTTDGYSLLGQHRRRYITYEYSSENDGLVRNESGEHTSKLPTWHAISWHGDKYIEWSNKDGHVFKREFYTDPHESRNLLYYKKDAPSAEVLRPFVRALHAAQTCRGTTGRNPCP